jgi:hypothetical protein
LCFPERARQPPFEDQGKFFVSIMGSSCFLGGQGTGTYSLIVIASKAKEPGQRVGGAYCALLDVAQAVTRNSVMGWAGSAWQILIAESLIVTFF